MSSRFAVLVDGGFDVHTAKTACCFIRYRPSEVAVVIDRATAGRTVADVIGFGGAIPIVADWDQALAHSPNRLLIGVVSPGGRFPVAWVELIERALLAGFDVFCGLHVFLSANPRLVAAATKGGATIHDLRKVPADLSVPTGARADVAARVVLAVGSDCNVGKMTVTYELYRTANARNLRYGFVATGQTGVLLHGRGIAIDRVISDFVAGAAERYLVLESPGQDVVLVEGQGCLTHPYFSAVTLGLLHGTQPDAMILCHDVARQYIRHTHQPVLSLPRLIEIYEEAASWLRPARVIGIGLATHSVDADAGRRAIAEARNQTGLPVEDVVRWPTGELLTACEGLRLPSSLAAPASRTATGSRSKSSQSCCDHVVRAATSAVSILELRTRDPFTIAHGSLLTWQNILLHLRVGEFDGYGESAPRPYHGDDLAACMGSLQSWCDRHRALCAETLDLDATLAAFVGPRPARAALDLALHDIAAQRCQQSLSVFCGEHYGLTRLGLNDRETPPSSYTVGIASDDEIERKVRAAAGWPTLKIKLGTSCDIEIVERVRACTDVELRVDANCAWSVAETRLKARRLADLGVTLIEQPLGRDALDGYRELHGTSALPIVVDESCRTVADVREFAGVVDGVNIKLSKVGGIRNAIEMIVAARQLRLRVMLGCFIESSLAITAATALAPLVDYLDLDGAVLLALDPFVGADVVHGVVGVSTEPGIGARPRPDP